MDANLIFLVGMIMNIVFWIVILYIITPRDIECRHVWKKVENGILTGRMSLLDGVVEELYECEKCKKWEWRLAWPE